MQRKAQSEVFDAAKALFSQYASDASGAIGASELQALVRSLGKELADSDLAKAMSSLDEDGSGAVGLPEFLRWWSMGLSVSALTDCTEASRMLAQSAVAKEAMLRRQNQSEAGMRSQNQIEATRNVQKQS